MVVGRAPWWVPWLVVLIALVAFIFYQFTAIGSVAQTNQEARSLIRASQIESCERVNLLREELNDQSEILRQVLQAASESALARGDRDAAHIYVQQMGNLDQVDVVECTEAFPEGIEQAGFVPVGNSHGDANR